MQFLYRHVQGIEKLMHITRVPKTPRYVKGVINLRGVVTPIIDLRERFGLIASENEDNVSYYYYSIRRYGSWFCCRFCK